MNRETLARGDGKGFLCDIHFVTEIPEYGLP